MIPILEVSLALIFFANKALWLIGKREGWRVGFVAAVVSIYYFYEIELYIFTALEAGFAVLMWYGFTKGEHTDRRVDVFVRATLTVTMGLLTYFLFEGLLTVVEFTATLFVLWGAYFLTGTRIRWGWAIMGVGHLLSTIVFYDKGQEFLAHFQIASAVLSGAGVLKGGNSVIESST